MRLLRTPKTRTTAVIRQCRQAALDAVTTSLLRAIRRIRGFYSPNLRGMSARVCHFDRSGTNLSHTRMTWQSVKKGSGPPRCGRAIPDNMR